MERKGEVLLVEDNGALNAANRRALESRGYRVRTARSLAGAGRLLEEREPDIILLDVMLPDGDGVDFCRRIRGGTRAHIIYLTAKTDYEDLSRGLMAGGDDYIRKPFHPRELLDRVEAAMRRQNMGTKHVSARVTCGPLTLDVVATRAYIADEDMLLSQKEFAALLLLVQNPGRVLEKEWLYRAVWGQPMAENSRALYTTISRLKKKLRPWEETVQLHAVRSDGYRLDLSGE